MKIFFPNLGIIQALLQTLDEIFQNTKESTIIYCNKSVFFSTIYMSSIIGRSQISECFVFKFNHLQPPDATDFSTCGRNY